MVKLFPSLIPDSQLENTYSKEELGEWEWLEELRPIAAELSTEKIDGRSTQLEVIHYLSGRFTKEQLDAMREQVQTDDPDFSEISNTETKLTSYNDSNH
jgi:hypothetical protein